jgi:GAF domain-containing protein
MNGRADEILKELGQLAANLGPALTPAGHDELLRSITEAARRLFDAAACSLALLEENQETLVFHVASGAGEEDVIGLRVPINRGIAGWVVTSGQPIAINDVTKDPRFARDVAESTGYVPRSILAMPLETEREMLGVIEVLDRGPGGVAGSNDMELLGLFARQAALAIENSRVFAGLGRALFTAAARGAEDGDLTKALEEYARTASSPDADLAQLAAYFNELSLRGPDERRAATALLGEFANYLKSRRRHG